MATFILIFNTVASALLVLLLLSVLWLCIRGCWSGCHRWYVPYPYLTKYGSGSHTCATFDKTGPLPNDDHYPDLYSGIVYRTERSCVNCDHVEYWDRVAAKWVKIQK